VCKVVSVGTFVCVGVVSVRSFVCVGVFSVESLCVYLWLVLGVCV
jgi:hypothetical protein